MNCMHLQLFAYLQAWGVVYPPHASEAAYTNRIWQRSIILTYSNYIRSYMCSLYKIFTYANYILRSRNPKWQKIYAHQWWGVWHTFNKQILISLNSRSVTLPAPHPPSKDWPHAGWHSQQALKLSQTILLSSKRTRIRDLQF